MLDYSRKLSIKKVSLIFQDHHSSESPCANQVSTFFGARPIVYFILRNSVERTRNAKLSHPKSVYSAAIK